MTRIPHALALVLALGGVAYAGEPAPKADKKAAEPAKPVMKLFMDIHRGLPKNMTDAQLAEGHNKDMAAEKKVPNTHYVRGWYDKDKGVLFCQCEAAKKEDCEKVHTLASGKPADEIYEVVVPK